MKFESTPTEKTSNKNEQAPQLSSYLDLMDERIAQAEVQLQKQNSEEWVVSESGFPVQPKGAAKATANLDYLRKARSMFTFIDAESSSLSWEEALKRVEGETKLLQDRYNAGFGKRDPKDVEGEKRDEAKKEYDEIKLRDKIVSEFSSITL